MISILNELGSDPTVQMHGYDLLKRTRLKSGTLYPALARLENFGWLESEWENIDASAEGRPRRKLYRLTAHGAREARLALDELRAELIGRPSNPIGIRSPGASPA